MKYHFIGDQGISMSGLKDYLKSQGHEVSGSDIKTGGHSSDNISDDIDMVVRTSAVSPGSPGWVEVEAAQEKGIKVIKRSELLGQITKGKRLIAVAGMHGKTTITALAGLALIEANLDPTVLVGEEVENLKGSLRIGRSEWFVVEACEYDRSFLDLEPEILIISNIEEEHLDTYPGGLAEIKRTFQEMIGKIKKNGKLIACVDDDNIRDLLGIVPEGIKVIPYGFSSNKFNSLPYKIAIPGRHNVLNGLAVTALAEELGINFEVVETVLSSFKGARRRFEYKGECNGAPVIDDYGHHPTEIKATLQAISERYPDKTKIVVFWPHQYKRILSLLEEFANAFDSADEVIIKPIFLVPGRDEILPVSSDDLARSINRTENKAKVMASDEEIAGYLKKSVDDSCVVLTIGIPPVYKVAELLV